MRESWEWLREAQAVFLQAEDVGNFIPASPRVLSASQARPVLHLLASAVARKASALSLQAELRASRQRRATPGMDFGLS